MVMISPESMTVLAAHAAAALDLLEIGISDESVASGLRDGAEFCAFLAQGQNGEKSSHFSAVGLAAGDYNSLVFSMPGGDQLHDRLPDVRNKLEKLCQQIREGLPSFDEHELGELRDYFFVFAERVPVYEGIHKRLIGERMHD